MMQNSSSFAVVANETDFIIVNKSANLDFHDSNNQAGLFNQVKASLKITELYPVHRLDKMTSGLVIMAKNLTTAQAFQQQFEQHTIEKYYLAVIDNHGKKKQGAIIGDMEKSRRGMWRLTKGMNNPAITQFQSSSLQPGLRLAILKPHSGKTHQLRVAMNANGSAIIGDPLYNKTSQADRGYLHAFALQFKLHNKHYQYLILPQQGKLFLSNEFSNAIEQFTPPWQLSWPPLKKASQH